MKKWTRDKSSDQGRAERHRDILAFCHIGKTGGTTLIHVLRRNFVFQYCDVEPIGCPEKKELGPEDLQCIFRINPFIRCIGGHKIRPYAGLHKYYPGMRYIGIFRDPVDRTISQYQQRVAKYGHISFEEFLKRPWLPNLQTRFVAGSEDLDRAKELIERNYILAGTLDRFDEFLAVLSCILGHGRFDPRYVRKRVQRNKEEKQRISYQYADDIREINSLDIDLVRHVREEVFPKARYAYESKVDKVLDTMSQSSRAVRTKMAMLGYMDYLMRKAYYRPMFAVTTKVVSR